MSVPVRVNGEFLRYCWFQGLVVRLCVYLPDGDIAVNQKNQVITVEARYQETIVRGTRCGAYVLNNPLFAVDDGKVILDVDLDLSRNPYRP